MATFRYSQPGGRLPPTGPALHAVAPAPVPVSTQAGDARRRLLQYVPLLSVVLLCKVSVPQLAWLGLGVDVPLIMAAMVAGLFSGLLQVHTARLMVYLAMLAWLGCTQLFRGAPFSATSMALLVLFLPLTLQLRSASPPGAGAGRALGPPDEALHVMGSLAAALAALGVLQFGLQHVVGATWAYPLENGLSPSWMTQGFNNLIPVAYGSETLKSNGVFFLEPSFFSQFMALGLLLELSQRSRLWRVLLLVAGLAVSYSGTGLIVAAVGLVGLVVVKGRWDLLLAGAVVVLLLALLDDVLPLQPLLGRASEFESIHSSGSARFVGWIDMFNQQWWPEPARVLFGAGAGSFAPNAAVARQPTAEMSFSKILFEYGITGAALFFGFLVFAFNSVRAPLALRLGLCTTLLVNGPFVAFPVGIAASVLLWPAPTGLPHPFHRSRRTAS